MTTRAARRAQERSIARRELPTAGRRRQTRLSEGTQPSKLRLAAFLLVATAVIGGGVYLAGNAIFSRSSRPAASGVIDLQVSMAGFEPKTVYAKPGQTLTFYWWNTDAAPHLERGVHTMVSDTLGLRLELPAQSNKTIEIKAPTTPGEYDYWCDSCCGGRDNPGMHGKIVVEA